MLQQIFGTLFAFLAVGTPPASTNTDEQQIREVITNFAAYGDQQNVTAMDAILDPGYRAVLNRLFGSKEVNFLDKAAYLQMLRDKKLGGDQRQVTIHSVDITNNNAVVKAEFAGQKMTLITFMLLTKTEAGDWKIVVDMPMMK